MWGRGTNVEERGCVCGGGVQTLKREQVRVWGRGTNVEERAGTCVGEGYKC